MASVSVVGQHPGPHRLDSEPLLFKLPGGRKKITLPRKSSWEKMMFRRSSGTSLDEMLPGNHPSSPGEPDRDREQSTAAGSPESRINGDSNLNTGALITNGLKGANRHRYRDRDAPGRRGTWNGGENAQPSGSSSGRGRGHTGSLPLERLTQGKTGVVKLARTEPVRVEAWSIFPRGCRDPRVRPETGEGHRFESEPCGHDWCDACSRQITAAALKCQNCSYTCHLECESQVQLDCNRKDREPEETPSPRKRCSSAAPQPKKESKEEDDRGTRELSEEEVRTQIKEYNAQVSKNGMKLALDGSYTGFIKVHLRLSRPVTVPAFKAADSEQASKPTAGRTQAPSDGQEGTDCGQSEKRTSFYLPSDCVKQLHISSLNTTREVIQGLLKKFMVLDNPCKFALYRQTHRDGQDLFQKLSLCERPLLLRLLAGPDAEQLSFVLKENETGEVEWHAFSVPELQNFLVILKKEEAERVRTVAQKYAAYRQKLQQALQQHDP
ncbi:ras association domain-containing protein 5 isoform X2 [Anoplopoma fimbria]|uniref:ras association domain-containing protein 5 isoform X2 n=1 Tax=Anoplopoma fimbria TaxID=229290 RepID=UPI0023EC2AB3|nr:ras association domain-containing protein 5 isoform X2 [Anoplopoma fimbria]